MMYVYVLIDPIDLRTIYVGVSASPRSRFSTHISMSKRRVTKKEKWIYNLSLVGRRPILRIEDGPYLSEEAYRMEAKWIRYYQEMGCFLMNERIPLG